MATHCLRLRQVRGLRSRQRGRRSQDASEWASEKCGIPEWTIKALARQWAKQATSITHGNGGPGIRSAYSTENAGLRSCFLPCSPGSAGQTLREDDRVVAVLPSQNPMPSSKFCPMHQRRHGQHAQSPPLQHGRQGKP